MSNRAPIIAGLSLLAVVAAGGWLRKPATNAAPANAPYAYGLTEAAAPPAPAPMAAQPAPAPAPERVVTRSSTRSSYVSSRRVNGPVYRKRSKKKSALIIGGSAATGAAIGALAGGGKGAAIGAISGGAAGLVYDRATHKKRVE